MTDARNFADRDHELSPDQTSTRPDDIPLGARELAELRLGASEGPSILSDSVRFDRWWPEYLGQPSSTGSQNDRRYAYFAHARRLVIEVDGKTTTYDTGDHQISGVSQQQSSDRSVTFTSQHGPVNVTRLPIV